MGQTTPPAPTVRLTGIPASHPVLAVALMLEHKRIAYARRDLPNMFHRPILPLLGFPGRTVPAVRVDGRRVQGSRAIARMLDELVPEPALFPAEEAARRRVEQLEAWADAELQEIVRRLGRWAAKRDPSSALPIALASDLPLPRAVVRAVMPAMGPALLASMRLSPEAAGQALRALPAALDRVDAAISEGVIGGDRPNAADFQVATCVRLATLIDELEPLLRGRPATAHAFRLAPSYPGRFREPLGLS